jgi:hypothetical protein
VPFLCAHIFPPFPIALFPVNGYAMALELVRGQTAGHKQRN